MTGPCVGESKDEGETVLNRAPARIQRQVWKESGWKEGGGASVSCGGGGGRGGGGGVVGGVGTEDKKVTQKHYALTFRSILRCSNKYNGGVLPTCRKKSVPTQRVRLSVKEGEGINFVGPHGRSEKRNRIRKLKWFRNRSPGKGLQWG